MSRVETQRAAQLEAELTDEERTLLDELAEGIAKRRMTAPAMFFFESIKPLAFVSSQVLHFLRPIVQSLWTNPLTYDRVTKLLERRGAVELLVRRLEDKA